MNDNKIVELYWQRKEDAIRETDLKYGAYCFAVANNILSNKEFSEECVNDTWLRAWNTIPPQRPNCLKMFLAKITRNLSFDKFKAENAYKRGGGEISAALDELKECLSDASDVESEIDIKELTSSINRFLHTLQKRESDVFLRRYFYVDSVSEIAKRYGLKKSNILVILSRTRKKLKMHLEKEGYVI